MQDALNKNKGELYIEGMVVMTSFCRLNDILAPSIEVHTSSEWPYSECAYYRNNVIHICLEKCAHIGKAGRAWSYPGYVTDRTPYGVIQHELGHHVDVIKGIRPEAYWSEYSENLRKHTNEPKLTSYCPNDAEWFAEMFRLFVTNPMLLERIRPLTFRYLRHDGFIPAFVSSWDVQLKGAPERTLNAASNKIKHASKMLLVEN